MARPYYIFQSGTLRRRQNTLYLENEGGRRPIPVEDVDSLFLFGEITLNTKLLDFLDKKGVVVHVFDYYENYSGSFYPRESLLSGELLVRQVEHYLRPKRRLAIAQELVRTALDNVLRNLKYYAKRVEDGEELEAIAEGIARDREAIDGVGDPLELMAVEGRARERYYQSFRHILQWDEPFEKRVKRPPDNPTNALLSFGNSLLYATVVSELYRTQLNPTVSFLHEPGARRFSLSLDLSEVFKPLIVDRTIFRAVNKRIIREEHFDRELNYCYLSEAGRKLFVQQYEERLQRTIEHRALKRPVSYRRLIRLECYKLIKHLLGDRPYEGFRMWW
jgi:CRISPR-associated protein Cas1